MHNDIKEILLSEEKLEESADEYIVLDGNMLALDDAVKEELRQYFIFWEISPRC